MTSKTLASGRGGVDVETPSVAPAGDQEVADEREADVSAQLTLAPNHQRLIADSAIDPDVARERGYRTVLVRAELGRLGFTEPQRNVPTLVIPVRNVHGELATYQSRPDSPRVRDGKPLKYETPKGTRMVLDVPLRARLRIADPSVPLLITEGIRKADSAVSCSLCCIALLGVWNWRGTNEHGGKTALPDWEAVALEGRDVYIVFDSDVMTKSSVHGALVRLKQFLESRKARVRVIYLPAGGGHTKVGLDDFLANGGDAAGLLALAVNDVRGPASTDTVIRYAFTEDGRTVYLKTLHDGAVVHEDLANFAAQIITDIVEDDGADTRRVYEIEARLRGQAQRFVVPAERFAAMNWPTELLGPTAIVRAGSTIKDRCREAFQTLSGNSIPQRRVYLHTGWREQDGRSIYLHAGGAIGAEGVVAGAEVRLSSPLDRYELPEPPMGEDLEQAVRTTLSLLDGLAPDEIMIPLLALPWMAVVHSQGQSLHLAGVTGSRKTEISSLIQSHFGAGMDALNLPGSWAGTANSLEGLAFLTKDSVFTVDDFNPVGSTIDVRRQHQVADRVFRGQANSRGRSRMRADGSLQPERHPRGVILSTGEDVPAGHSLRARMLIVDMVKDCVDLERLSECQAARPAYSMAMAGFIQWVAGQLQGLRAQCEVEVTNVRDELLARVAHGRTATLAAEFLVGFGLLVQFAVHIGAIAKSEAQALKLRATEAIVGVVAGQAVHQASSDPAELFLEFLGAALQAGLAHLADRTTGLAPAPDELARQVGWRSLEDGSRRACEPLVGWIDGTSVYLIPGAAYRVAQLQGSTSVNSIGIGEKALWKALEEKHRLLSHDAGRSTKKVRADGRARSCLHLSLDALFGPEPGPGGDDDGAVFPESVPVVPVPKQQREQKSPSKTPLQGSSDGSVPDVPDVPVPGDNTGCFFDDPRDGLLRPNAGEGTVSPYAVDGRGQEPWSSPGSGTTGTTGTTPSGGPAKADQGAVPVPDGPLGTGTEDPRNGNKPGELAAEPTLTRVEDPGERDEAFL